MLDVLFSERRITAAIRGFFKRAIGHSRVKPERVPDIVPPRRPKGSWGGKDVTPDGRGSTCKSIVDECPPRGQGHQDRTLVLGALPLLVWTTPIWTIGTVAGRMWARPIADALAPVFAG